MNVLFIWEAAKMRQEFLLNFLWVAFFYWAELDQFYYFHSGNELQLHLIFPLFSIFPLFFPSSTFPSSAFRLKIENISQGNWIISSSLQSNMILSPTRMQAGARLPFFNILVSRTYKIMRGTNFFLLNTFT